VLWVVERPAAAAPGATADWSGFSSVNNHVLNTSSRSRPEIRSASAMNSGVVPWAYPCQGIA
jgi:hypothetical protein